MLTEELGILLHWFGINSLQANPNIFQAMLSSSRRKKDKEFNLVIDGETITSVPLIKVLGIQVDSELSFKTHIQTIISNAGRQLNAIQRLRTNLVIKVGKQFISFL